MARVQKMDDMKNKTKIIIIFARKLDKQFCTIVMDLFQQSTRKVSPCEVLHWRALGRGSEVRVVHCFGVADLSSRLLTSILIQIHQTFRKRS
jgi:hypothetical protein